VQRTTGAPNLSGCIPASLTESNRRLPRLTFWECGDNDQREAVPLWLFRLLAIPAVPQKRCGARKASLPAAPKFGRSLPMKPGCAQLVRAKKSGARFVARPAGYRPLA